MNSPTRRRAWLPLAVFVVCAAGTLALAQPPGYGNRPPPGYGQGQPPQGQGQPPKGYQPPQGNEQQRYGPMGANPNPPPGGGEQERPGGGMPNRGMGNMGMPNAGMPDMGGIEQKMWSCGKCGNSWADTGGATPTSCPKCKAKFSHVTDADGKTTTTTYGKSTYVKWIIIGLVVAGSVVVAIIKGIMAASSGGGAKKKVKKKKKPMRRPRDDDDY